MSDSSPLFRPAAQEAQRTQPLGDILLIRPLSFTLLTSIALCMALCVILFFTFGAYTRRTTVSGLILPDTGLVKVYAPQPGIVVAKHITEGQRVKQGDVLYTVSTESQSTAQGHTQAALIAQALQHKTSLRREIDKTTTLHQDERHTLEAKIRSLHTEIGRLDDQLTAQRARTSIATDAAARYRGLLEQDYISKDQAQQRHAEQLDQQSQLHSLQRERSRTTQTLREASTALAGLALKQQNQLSALERQVIEVDQRLIESEARREVVITAPEAGTVTTTIAERGQMTRLGHPLASIVPADAHWQAHLFVPSSAVGFIRNNAPVLIRYETYPYQKFGQYDARVSSISRTALSAEELATSGGFSANQPTAGGTFFRVIAALKSQTVTVYGEPSALQAGMALSADVMQERRRLYEWILEPLYSLTGKL